MIEFDEKKVEQLAVEAIANDFANKEDFEMVAKDRIRQKIDELFAEKAEALLGEAVDEAFKNALEKEYRKVDCFGKPEGETTSIKNELSKLTDAYWSQKVDRNGKPTTATYNVSSRAQYLMTQICAQDFSEQMKQATLSITGSLKDSLRNNIAREVDALLSSLFHVKSLQDQGKVEKPW